MLAASPVFPQSPACRDGQKSPNRGLESITAPCLERCWSRRFRGPRFGGVNSLGDFPEHIDQALSESLALPMFDETRLISRPRHLLVPDRTPEHLAHHAGHLVKGEVGRAVDGCADLARPRPVAEELSGPRPDVTGGTDRTSEG
jgi:hypothetical protein